MKNAINMNAAAWRNGVRLIGCGEMSARMPRINVPCPKTVLNVGPNASPYSLRFKAFKLTASSGNDVPMPMSVAPMISSDNEQLAERFMAHVTASMEPMSTREKLASSLVMSRSEIFFSWDRGVVLQGDQRALKLLRDAIPIRRT